MAGTWETQDKVLPGAYINIRTNEPLSITPGDRGIAVILQEMSVGEDGQTIQLQPQSRRIRRKQRLRIRSWLPRRLKRPKQYWSISCQKHMMQMRSTQH